MKLNRLAILLTAWILTTLFGVARAAVWDPDSILAGFDARFVVLDNLIHRPGSNSMTAAAYTDMAFDRSRQKYGDTALADSLYEKALQNSVEQQARYIKSATGLQITGQTYYRLDGAIGLDDDDNAVSRYNAKIQAEARWNFFKSGLWHSDRKIREVQLQADIDKIAYEKETRGTEVARRREFYRALQDSVLCSVLSHRVRNLSMLSDAYSYLLANENVSSDDLLNILNERAEAERKLMGLTVQDVWADDLSQPFACIVELDTAAFLRYVELNQADFRIAAKRQELFEQRAKNESYWNDVDVSPFVRYSYYTRPNFPNSSNVDAGVYFKIPLNNEAKKHKEALLAQAEVLGAETYLRMRQIADEVSYISVEISRLNRSIEGEYRRSMELRKYLAERKRAYENRHGEFSRLARMKEYNAYLVCLERLLEFQISRDQHIASLAKFLTGESVAEFCTVRML